MAPALVISRVCKTWVYQLQSCSRIVGLSASLRSLVGSSSKITSAPRPVAPEPLPRKKSTPPASVSRRSIARRARLETHTGENLPEKRAFDEVAHRPTVIPSEFLGIRRTDERFFGVSANEPGGEQVRGELGLAVSGRKGDLEPLVDPFFDLFEGRAKHFVVLGGPVKRHSHIVLRVGDRHHKPGERNQVVARQKDRLLAFEQLSEFDPVAHPAFAGGAALSSAAIRVS